MSGSNTAVAQNGPETQAQLLEKAKHTVQVESFYMKRCLRLLTKKRTQRDQKFQETEEDLEQDGNKLMDALKHSSNMVSQLRTSLLAPKQYYDLYMYCFDQLKYLEAYLIDEKEKSDTKMSKLYELVQYAGNILPRLYLLITVGSAYVRSEEAAAQDILSDLVEMCRGVQHPLRGLFVRNYLSEMTKDKLPDIGNAYEGKGGTVSDSIEFILSNFTEMNKLWVRMEPLKGSVMPKEREQKQKERDDLRLLVGKNLARIGQLEGVDVEKYKEVVLPRISKQIVSCKDKVAQQYLMECIVQIFPDEYHLVTLDELLSLCAQLEPTVNVKAIIVSLLGRLINFAGRNSESVHEAISSVAGRESASVDYFAMFFNRLQTLFEGQAEDSVTTFADKLEMLVNLMNLTLKFYPKAVGNVNDVLVYCAKLLSSRNISPCTETPEVNNLVKLLRLPLTTFSVVVVLDLETTPILQFLSYQTHKNVAIEFLKSVIEHETQIAEPDTVKKLFDFVSPLIREVPADAANDMDEEDFLYEQNLVAAALHMFTNENPIVTFKICGLAKDILAPQGANPKRVVQTLVPLIFKVLSIAGDLQKACESEGADWVRKGKEIFQFIYLIVRLFKEPNPALSLRLFLAAAQTACLVGFGMIANDFLCEALVLYEELAHSSVEQQNSLTLIISTLNSVSGVDPEKYDALATKCAHHSARLLKKPDQCRLILKASHLFTRLTAEGDQSDGRFTLDCLQKCLRVADQCLEVHVKVQLFVDILNECLYFFVNKSETVTVQFLNSLIDLIHTNIEGERSSLQQSTSLYYKNTLKYIKFQQQNSSRWAGVEIGS